MGLDFACVCVFQCRKIWWRPQDLNLLLVGILRETHSFSHQGVFTMSSVNRNSRRDGRLPINGTTVRNKQELINVQDDVSLVCGWCLCTDLSPNVHVFGVACFVVVDEICYCCCVCQKPVMSSQWHHVVDLTWLAWHCMCCFGVLILIWSFFLKQNGSFLPNFSFRFF